MTGACDGAAGLLDESQPDNRTRTTTVTARTDTRASGNMASRMLPPRHHGEDPAFALRATADKRRACQPSPAVRELARAKAGAGGGNRTHTTLASPRILSPVRLPVSPPRRVGIMCRSEDITRPERPATDVCGRVVRSRPACASEQTLTEDGPAQDEPCGARRETRHLGRGLKARGHLKTEGVGRTAACQPVQSTGYMRLS